MHDAGEIGAKDVGEFVADEEAGVSAVGVVGEDWEGSSNLGGEGDELEEAGARTHGGGDLD